jgi:hypothetical protein
MLIKFIRGLNQRLPALEDADFNALNQRLPR